MRRDAPVLPSAGRYVLMTVAGFRFLLRDADVRLHPAVDVAVHGDQPLTGDLLAGELLRARPVEREVEEVTTLVDRVRRVRDRIIVASLEERAFHGDLLRDDVKRLGRRFDGGDRDNNLIHGICVAACNGYIYAVGGHETPSNSPNTARLKCVER